jgi:hypothetical protein
MNAAFDMSVLLGWCKHHRQMLDQWIVALEADAPGDRVDIRAAIERPVAGDSMSGRRCQAGAAGGWHI